MTPRIRTELFRLGVDLAAVAALLASLPALASSPRPQGLLMISLALLGVLALQFTLSVTLTERISVATAVFFAALLLFPPADAAILIGATALVSGVVSMARKFASDRMLPIKVALPTIAFNSAQTFLSALCGELVLAATGTSAVTLGRPSSLLGLVAAAATMYLINILVVCTAVALSSSRNPLRVSASQQRTVMVQSAVLYLIGTVAAVAAAHAAWTILLMAIPAVLAHRSLSRRIQISQSVIRRVEQTADEVDARDPYTFHHSRRVAEYSLAMAVRLGLSAGEVQLLRLAAMVHDVGKIEIPDSILLKPGKLTDLERVQMELHPRLGYDYLAEFSEYARVRELVLTHHERYDGGGYPNGTKGSRLPLIAQIMPVADSLDAMTSDRPYRAALSWEHALGELERGAGSQWSPRVVEAALRCFREPAKRPARVALKAA